MSYFTDRSQNGGNKPQTNADRTRNELSVRKQLSRFDSHINDEKTSVRLDKVTSSKDGTKRRRYIVSENGREKYRADFREENKKQKLEQLVIIKRTKKKETKK